MVLWDWFQCRVAASSWFQMVPGREIVVLWLRRAPRPLAPIQHPWIDSTVYASQNSSVFVSKFILLRYVGTVIRQRPEVDYLGFCSN